MEPRALPGLGIDDDPAYHARENRVARVGRWAVAAVVVAALLGVFGGGGPLVSAQTAKSGGFSVRYDQFARLDAPLQIAVTLPPGATGFTLTGDAAIFQVEAISPTPAAEEARPGGVHYAFPPVPTASTVTVFARPNQFGWAESAVVLDGGPRHRLRHFVYP